MSITAMKQALAALEKSVATCFDQYAHEQVMSHPEHFINQSLASLRQAIAKAEKQEPVMYWNGNNKFAPPKAKEWDKRTGGTTAFGIDIPLYTTPQPQQEKRESVPVCEYCKKERPVIHAPKREWVGLTNNDLQPIAEEYRILFGSWVHDFAQAIEAKLKEKNT